MLETPKAAPYHDNASETDARQVAEEAGLRYVSDSTPGIARRPRGDGFAYFDPAGEIIKSETTLKRIRGLAIPPAYSDVWICPRPNGHIQATGRDARGRKQYRYDSRWVEARDQAKFEHMVEFASALPALRSKISADMAKPGLPREKVLATIVHLLETTLIRVGNEGYAEENKSYGLTTLRNRHVAVASGALRFRFKGKSGKAWNLTDQRPPRRQDHQSLPGASRSTPVRVCRSRGCRSVDWIGRRQ